MKKCSTQPESFSGFRITCRSWTVLNSPERSRTVLSRPESSALDSRRLSKVGQCLRITYKWPRNATRMPLKRRPLRACVAGGGRKSKLAEQRQVCWSKRSALKEHVNIQSSDWRERVSRPTAALERWSAANGWPFSKGSHCTSVNSAPIRS